MDSLPPPLDGVRVVDLTSYIAGSYGPMILAQLGAKVIKIESLEGDSFRHFGFGFLGWNQGKHGLSVNLDSDGGREIMGVRHKQHPTFGLQFHPESFLTQGGIDILRRFLEVK